ncbi:MAG: T9SS type A sorting domain-containing protein [Candidatus Kapaibacterium sp.]
MQGDSLFERQSYTLEIIADTATSVTEQLSDVPLRIYPNPACSMITIDGREVFTSYTIVDIHGRSVMAGVASTSIDISPLNSGVYMFTLVQGSHVHTVRFVKD